MHFLAGLCLPVADGVAGPAVPLWLVWMRSRDILEERNLTRSSSPSGRWRATTLLSCCWLRQALVR